MERKEVQPLISSKYVIFDRGSKNIVYPMRGTDEFYDICELIFRLEICIIPGLYDKKDLVEKSLTRAIKYDKDTDKYYLVERTELGDNMFQDKYDDITPEIKHIQTQREKIEELQTDFTTQLRVKNVLFDDIYRYLKSVRCIDKTGFGMILLDIDDFKKVNDEYGHVVGDIVLREVSKIAQLSVRFDDNNRLDIVGRYGGEEIGILLKNTTPEGLMVTAERIRKNIANNNTKVPVTVSVGAVHSDDLQDIIVGDLLNADSLEGKQQMIQRMFERADAAMYESKRLGKNKVTVWSIELEEEIKKRNETGSLKRKRTI